MSDRPARKSALGWVVLALAMGMLIWVRLRLVTDIPRSAYADPQGRERSGADPEVGTRSSGPRDGAEVPGRLADGAESPGPG